MNRPTALPTALLTLSLALGTTAPAAFADGPGTHPAPSTSFSNGYHPMSGATSGPPDRPSVESGPAIVEPAGSSSAEDPTATVNVAAETEAAGALPITATDLALLGGAAALLLVIAELFRRSSSRGRGA